MRRHLRRALTVLAPLAIVIALTVALASPASASTFRRSYVLYNGAGSSLQFYEDCNGSDCTMSSIRLALQLPRGGLCVSSRMLIDGHTSLWGSTQCDTDGNGHFTWWLGSYAAHSGSVVTAWFSDPYTVYAARHPALIL